ncbi:MAG: NADH-quinone oxidoreductase subunit NuoH [Thermoanaerobaculaceae bacterium]|nr:NADH-quinone oxidoreductase subunit NuoH [Thermoanaerobaculaceae bacterium]MDI9622944.1 NADH-quinone oxidoreductase subunit NuoH [Acidobacteriota bacterium]NLH11861.1 NADH-quinone oxidoreductase subunit NuoH [Holophagae bacterium]HPW56870.1 NADH-quinone oxidoreductase subunit NuoH [Thermoanaerobaculaceae bacterium]
MGAELIVIAGKLIVLATLLLTAVPVMVWVERRGAAFIQDRLGPNRVGPWGIIQPIADSVKLLFKEDLTPAGVNRWLYFLAPMISVFIAMLTFIVVPFGDGCGVTILGQPLGSLMVASELEVGVLYLLAISSLGVYGIVLAGWSSNNKYSLLGGLRASAQLISYELSMALAVLGVILATGSLRLDEVVAAQSGKLWNAVPQFLGFVVFVVAAFAETNRLPFDLAEAETELVAGYHVEYSSMKFAAFMMSEYMNMVTVSALLVTLFLGGSTLPGVHLEGWLGLVVSLAVFLGKVAFFMWLFVWVRWSLPRFRYDQLMRLGWKGLLPLATVNLVLVAVGVARGWTWI